jgi:hypothetical protein
VGLSSGSVFAWFILWSVSLGFFSGSGVFPLGLGGPVGGNGVGFGALRGSFCIRKLLLGVSLILWRFLLCLLGVFLWAFFGFFYGLAEFASVYTSCVLRGTLRFFNEILLLIKKKKYVPPHRRHITQRAKDFVICENANLKFA